MFISLVDNHSDRLPGGTLHSRWDTAARFDFRVCDTCLLSQQPPYFAMVMTSLKGPTVIRH